MAGGVFTANRCLMRITLVTVLGLVVLILLRNQISFVSPVESNIKKRPSTNEMRGETNSSIPTFLGTGYASTKVLNSTIQEAQTLYHSLMTKVEYNCSKMERFGKPGDGGYWLCLDGPLKPQYNNCLVYSFGINNEWSFDNAMNDEFGCEVHSFDPSMKMKDHVHREPNMFFHSLGLSGSSFVDHHGWQLRDLGSIIKLNQHQNRVIDVLKVDIEGAEWPFLVDFVKSGLYKHVRQLIIEPHTPLYKNNRMTIIDYAEAYDTFEILKEIGLQRFLFQTRNNCCHVFARIVHKGVAKKDLCCYEQFFINEFFL